MCIYTTWNGWDIHYPANMLHLDRIYRRHTYNPPTIAVTGGYASWVNIQIHSGHVGPFPRSVCIYRSWNIKNYSHKVRFLDDLHHEWYRKIINLFVYRPRTQTVRALKGPEGWFIRCTYHLAFVEYTGGLLPLPVKYANSLNLYLFPGASPREWASSTSWTSLPTHIYRVLSLYRLLRVSLIVLKALNSSNLHKRYIGYRI